MAAWKNDSSGNPVPPVWNGTEAVPMEVDKDGNFPEIESVHRRLHKGQVFDFCDDLASQWAGASTDYLFTVNASSSAHFLFGVRSTDAGSITLYEAPTITANGTLQTPNNRNRASTNTPTMTVHKGPTNTGLGTMLCKERFGSGNRAGGDIRSENEWILKPGVKYLARVTNDIINANLTVKFNWYEVAV